MEIVICKDGQIDQNINALLQEYKIERERGK